MARKLALLLLALLAALFLWRRSSPEPVPIAISAPDAHPVRAQPAEVEATEAAGQPSRAEVQPDPEAQASSALPESEAEALLCVRVFASDTGACSDAWVSVSRFPEACDAQGLIVLHTRGPLALRAGAPGYLAAHFAAEPGHETPEKALPIVLQRAASLVVVLEDAPQGGFPSVSVTQEPILAGDPQATVFGPSGQGFFDSKGRAQIDELPPYAPLRVRICDGHAKLVDYPDPVWLKPGEKRELSVRLRDTCRVNGRALDERGAPVEGVVFWLLPSISPPRLLVEPGEHNQASTSSSTDAEGHFVFESVLPGTWRLAPAVSSRSLDLFVSQDEIAPVVQLLEIRAGAHEQSIEYRVQRGFTISGVVLDAEGQPARGVRVGARLDSCADLAQSQVDGRFVLGPVPPGTYEIAAGDFVRQGSSTLRVPAGARDVVLRLQRLGRITGHVLDASAERSLAAQVTLLRQDVPEGGDFRAFSDAYGSFAFEGLQPGEYALAATSGDGRIGISSGVTLGQDSEVAGLAIKLVSGARVKVRSESADSALLFIEQDGLRIETCALDPDSATAITVPEGALFFVLRHANGRAVARSLALVAGEERELVFKAQD